MTRLPRSADLLVVIPAHDESARVVACLGSVLAAAERAVEFGHRVHLVLAAHRCGDDTAELAQAVFAQVPGPAISGSVLRLPRQSTVGAVRSIAARSAIAAGLAGADASTWLFSTDADSTVPIDWLVDGLAEARAADSAMVLGLVDLAEADERLRQRHDDVVAAGLGPDGTHRHAYAANLMIRTDAFTAVGGFPAVAHGEEHALAAAVRSAGLLVSSSVCWRVQTSSRVQGRAAGGLASLLSRLSADQPDPPARDAASGSARISRPRRGAWPTTVRRPGRGRRPGPRRRSGSGRCR